MRAMRCDAAGVARSDSGGRCLELAFAARAGACYKEQPADAIDFLAKFLFERSGDDGPVDDDEEETLNPLHWLGQYLMRHNVAHGERSFPSEASPRLYEPLRPTKLRDGRAATPERRASPRTYPAALEPKFEDVGGGVLRLYRENHRFRVGLEDQAMVLEVFRDEVARSVDFKATNLQTGKSVLRRASEAELMDLVSSGDKWGVGISTAALELAPKVRVLKKKYSNALKLGFAGTKETAVERLTSTTRRCDSKLYVVDVLREPTPGGSTDRKLNDEKGDLCALRFRAYHPDTSTYIEARVPGQRLHNATAKMRDQVQDLADRVDVVVVPDGGEHVLVKLHAPYDCDMLPPAGGPDDGKRCRVQVSTGLIAAAAVTADEPDQVRMVAAVVDLWGGGDDPELQAAARAPKYLVLPEESYEGVPDLALSIAPTAPELQALTSGLRYDPATALLSHKAMQRARSLLAKRFDAAVELDATLKKGEVVLGVDAATGLQVPYKYDQKIVDKRDRLFALRRDQSLMDAQRPRGEDGALVYRQGVQMSNMYMIVSVFRLSASVTGSLKFTAYEPTQCAQLELDVDHLDTRPLSSPLAPAGKRLAKQLCARLRLEKSDKGRGPPALVLWEVDPVSTKMKRAFDGLHKDSRGRAGKADVVDLFATAQNELDHFLAPPKSNKAKLPPIVGFDAVATSLETAKRRIADDARTRIDFHTFSKVLLDAE